MTRPQILVEFERMNSSLCAVESYELTARAFVKCGQTRAEATPSQPRSRRASGGAACGQTGVRAAVYLTVQTVLNGFINTCPDLFLPEVVSTHRVTTVCGLGNEPLEKK